MLTVYDAEIGRHMTSELYQLLNAIWKAKRENHPWDVVDLCIKIFQKKQPERYKSYLIRLEEVKQAQKVTNVGNKRFRGVSKDKVHGAYLAHVVDFPFYLMALIRKVYDTSELIMDKEFFREFGMRYPQFKIMERV